MALSRELHRIGDQIGDDLRDPYAIADHHAVRRIAEVRRQRKPLGLGPRAAHLHDRADIGPQVKRRGRQGELACLHFRQVQHIVQHPTQGVAGAGDEVQHIVLAGRQGRVRQRRSQPQHGVQRGADLMADVRKEAIPRLGGLARFRLRNLQRLQRPHVIRDLEANGRIGFRPPIRPEIRHNGGVHPVGRASLGAVLNGAAPYLTARNGAVQIAEIVARVGAGVHYPVRLADQFLARIAADRLELVVAIQDAAGAVGDRHNGGLVQCGREPRPAGPIDVRH
uniref:LigA n=1 Tax=Parastrongyloides trichosuri TaxID=131310 RepID=A0A0N4Z7G9_PARTI